MHAARLLFALLPLFAIVASFATRSDALSGPVLQKESASDAGLTPPPCQLPPSLNGSCANYRWYNLCSGYLWLYYLDPGESVGSVFGGPSQPCIAPGNTVQRVITYYRTTLAGYGGVKVFLHRDDGGDGCPDATLAASGAFYPAERWNCAEFGAVIPPGVDHVVVRQFQDFIDVPNARPGGRAKDRADITYVATDGPYSQSCDPVGIARSFYYGYGNMPTSCTPWAGPTSRHDNFLIWLVVNGGPTTTTQTTWGGVKGLFR